MSGSAEETTRRSFWKGVSAGLCAFALLLGVAVGAVTLWDRFFPPETPALHRTIQTATDANAVKRFLESHDGDVVDLNIECPTGGSNVCLHGSSTLYGSQLILYTEGECQWDGGFTPDFQCPGPVIVWLEVTAGSGARVLNGWTGADSLQARGLFWVVDGIGGRTAYPGEREFYLTSVGPKG